METSTKSERPPLIDVRHNGMGDVVVASWIVHSALAVGQRVRINAHDQPAAASILSVPADLLEMADALHWRSAAGEAHRLECAFVDGQPMSRFDAWCQNAGLPPLEPVRPPYDEKVVDGAWADEQWQAVDPSGTKPRVLIFPEAAWHIRMWPYAYSIDLATKLVARGYAVAACAGSSTNVQKMPCHWWGGFTVRQVAAMARRATLVIANDSGPAHLAGAIGTRTLALCGASHPAVVFAHDPNVRGVTFDKDALPCVGCHFSYDRGYRPACNEGCQAMMRLDPQTVAAIASAAIEETLRKPFNTEIAETAER